MFIQTESTPNPATLKFLPGLTVLESGSAHFDTVEEASVSPLAERLFEVEGVTGVFLGSDFITVHKTEDREWFLIKPSILGLIMEHFTAGRPVMRATEAAGESKICSTPASAPQWPWMAAISSSTNSRTVWSICTCAAPALAVRPRPRP